MEVWRGDEKRGLQRGRRLVKGAPRWCGCIAQLVEQLTLNQRVQGSSPCAPTNDFKALEAKSQSQSKQKSGLGNTLGNKTA